MSKNGNFFSGFRRLVGALVFAICAIFFGANAAYAACTSGQIDVLGDGTQCETSKFEVTTTNDTSVFTFVLGTKGTFYVDWGDGSAVQTIARDNVTITVYTHTYAAEGSYVIRFGSANISAYIGGTGIPAISFYKSSDGTQSKIASISGSLGALLPQLSTVNGQFPRFAGTFQEAVNLSSLPAGLFDGIVGGGNGIFSSTFRGCTGLTSIPEELFSGITIAAQALFDSTFERCSGLTSIPEDLFSSITTSADYLFSYTFKGCSGLTSIPEDLFSGITPGADYMFRGTFENCSGLTSIPGGLFGDITTSADHMFSDTFKGCRNITSIPAGLFSSITTGAAPYLFAGTFQNCSGLTGIPSGLFSRITTSANYLFSYTFAGCSGLTSIPAELFSGITTSAERMFQYTFSTCSSLTTIPRDLFSGITTGANYMFNGTFQGDTSLSRVPSGLFRNITTGANYMFQSTFNGCSNMSEYIPPTTFAGLITNGSPYSTNMMSAIFYGCNKLLSSCPTGASQYTTGYESYWNNKVSCEPCVGTIPEHASYTTAGTCDWACDSGYMNTGTSCEAEKFSVTTTSGATTLSWIITSTGEFYVDCGDEGRLSQRSYITGSTTSGKKITRTTAGIKTIYSCTWNSAGVHTVRFGGVATGYSTSTTDAAITFYHSSGTPAMIASIDGSLGAMFPTINGAIPRFYQTFQGCKNLTGIPTGLFSAIDTSSATDTSSMFAQTFYGCTGLTGIPAELFSAIDTSSATSTSYMFYQTFYGCTGLTSIPAELFSANDTSSATDTSSMFAETFWNCNNLTSIPAGLFGAIDTSSATDTSYMFRDTFYYCKKITNIPTGLFGAIDTSSATNTAGMFHGTFWGCNKITNIPTGLFSGVDTSSATNTSGMFYGTFGDVSGLTSIPTGLFSGIDTSSATDTHDMFRYTFHGCSKITSIPSGLFSGVDTSSSTNTQSMFSATFGDCTRLTEIPTGLFSAVNTSSAIYAQSMFSSTFYGCKGVTEIPSGLFSGVDTSSVVYASDMFSGTFYGCTGLTGIPAGLFSAIDTSSATDTSRMFQGTFNGCSNITGYIPPTAFPNTIQPGSSTNSNMWSNTFNGTQLLTQCPLGTTQYITGFESDWNGKVSCEPCVGTIPEHASYTTAGTCDWACDSGYMNTGTSCEQEKFSVTTSSLTANTTFKFNLSAQGTFYVDWGDGSAVQTITRSNTTATDYTHTYTTAGAYTIKFSSNNITAYNTSTTTPAITFYKSSGGSQAKIASVSGSLGALLPVVGTSVPRFYQTFRGATSLASIPATLFSGLNTSSVTNTSYMFYQTFYGCTGLTGAIPTGLFNAIDTGSSTNTSYMFYGTFYGCNKITSIPTGLFSTIDTSNATNTSYMFDYTFYNCSGLTGIPAGLFSEVDTSNATNTSYMFYGTFYGCNKITSIPTGLFSTIDTSNVTNPSYMFADLFYGCSSLTNIPTGLFSEIDTSKSTYMVLMFSNAFNGTAITSIPADLFSTIDTSRATYTDRMFFGTFSNCTSLTGIPDGLFSNIQTPNATSTNYMFADLFKGSSSLSGYIPANTFSSALRLVSYYPDFESAFSGTQIATQCPVGMTQYITGFENGWGYSNSNVPNDDGSTRVSCTPCAAGTYKDVVGNQACSACANGTYMADTGATSCTACPALDTGYAYADGTGWTGWNQCSEQMRPINCYSGYLTKPASSASAWGTAVSTLTAAGGYKVTGSGNNTVCSACGAGYYSPSGANTCTACASGLITIGYGPGADEAGDCGHKFHAGDGILYLRSVKKTTPSLNVRIGNAVFYGNMSTLEKVMSAGSTRKLKINNGGTIYHVHDDSVDLPSGYTQVAYVQSSGNQAIDTGIIMTNAHEVRAKFNPSALSKYLYGSVSSDNSTSYTAYLSSAGNWRFGNRTIAIPTSANTLYESVQNSSGVTINGVSKGTYASTTFTSPNSLVLFGSHSAANAVSPNFSGKVYYIKIYNNGDVVFDGVPAKRNSDNVCGLYDMANNVFYASHTATAFICP